MDAVEILSIIATLLGVTCFSAVFTILYLSYVKSAVGQVESGKRDIELLDAALSEKSERAVRFKRAGSAVKTVLFTLFLLIVIPLILFSLVNRIADDRPVLGKTVMVVASGSMSFKNEENGYLTANRLDDQFDRYDIIVLEKVESPSELKLYDVIAYKNSDGVNIIHRIVAISDVNGDLRITTRGDANTDSDSFHPTFSDVIGVYRGTHVAMLGVVVMFLQSWSGIITIVALLYCLIMIDRFSGRLEKAEERRLGQLLSAIETDGLSANSMRAEFKETIYCRGYAYRFDENGFVGKLPQEDGLHPNGDKTARGTGGGSSEET